MGSQSGRVSVSRAQVLAYRVIAQQLHTGRQGLTEPAILDLGVQDTGTDGVGWALVNRGVPIAEALEFADELAFAWTLRGAPHAYRRADIAQIATATWPHSDADAGKRIFDAATPMRKQGVGELAGLQRVVEHLSSVVTAPMVKGEVSTALTARAEPWLLRYCRPCAATHCYEQPFRLAALRAGLELEPFTSPPVLTPIKGWRGPAKRVRPELDPVRACLHLLGPATPKLVAGYIDGALADVKSAWPDDVATVEVDGEPRQILAADLDTLTGAAVDDRVRLLAPFDLFLQARDRELLVAGEAHRKELWRTLGRPGGVLRGGEIVGTWRARKKGRRLEPEVSLWADVAASALDEQCERLAEFRGLELAKPVVRAH